MKMADKLSVALPGALNGYRRMVIAAEGRVLRVTGFVIRCSGTAIAAWGVSFLLGLCQPVWASISALVISHCRLDDTRSCSIGRVFGTFLGIAVSLAVTVIASKFHVPLPAQMAVAVAICAIATFDLPSMRVAMWTCPLILLAARTSAPLMKTAQDRGIEVALGALVGLALHWTCEILADAVTGRKALASDHAD